MTDPKAPLQDVEALLMTVAAAIGPSISTQLRAHIAALESENKRLREALALSDRKAWWLWRMVCDLPPSDEISKSRELIMLELNAICKSVNAALAQTAAIGCLASSTGDGGGNV